MGVLILCSAFFSSSETGMIALNRYRLRHLAKDKQHSAMLASALLEKPDRLIGVILFGNNVVNFIAAAIGTIIGFRLLGNYGAAISPFVIAIIFIIFAEMTPKTFAVFHPERVAFHAVYILQPLLYICYPIVYLLNKISNSLLLPFGINTENAEQSSLSQDEFRSIVYEAGASISSNHQDMLLNIMDMDKVTVGDIMVTRNEMVGINLNDSTTDILEQLSHCKHTRLLVYHGDIDNIIGMLHTRRILRILNNQNEFNTEELKQLCDEPYYLLKGTSLYTQMLKFQQDKQRTGLIVDEYGVLQGMVTLDDILEEIIGEFTTNLQTFNQNIQLQEDNSYIINGSTTIRDINKRLGWQLSTDGPKTINGFILKYLEDIPEADTSLRIKNHTFEITQVVDNAIKKVKVFPLVDSAEAENTD